MSTPPNSCQVYSIGREPAITAIPSSTQSCGSSQTFICKTASTSSVLAFTSHGSSVQVLGASGVNHKHTASHRLGPVQKGVSFGRRTSGSLAGGEEVH